MNFLSKEALIVKIAVMSIAVMSKLQYKTVDAFIILQYGCK